MRTDNQSVLDTGHIGRLLLKLTAPIFIGVLIQNIYNITDVIFVGHYVGSDALAAMSIIMPIQMLTMGTGNMVSVGGASLISRLIGQKDPQRAERALGNSLFFAVVFSAILMLGILPFIHFWLTFIGTSVSVMPFATSYLTITIAGTVLNITGVTLLSMVRAEGNARVSMISMILGSLLNISLDALFMIGLHMGIAGAAWAMVISQGAALIYISRYYLSGKSYLKIHWRNLWPNAGIVRDIFAIGVSQFLKAIADCLSTFILVRMVSRYGGDEGLSAFSIVQRVMMFSSLWSMVLGQAMQPILGFNYGARRFREALRSINLAAWTSTAFGMAALALLLIFPTPIIGIFTTDPKLITASTIAFRIMFLGMPLFSFFNVASLVFPATGKVMPTLLIFVIRSLLFIGPLSWLLSHFFQMAGTWATFPVSDTLSFFLVLGFLIPLIRKFRKMAREQDALTPVKL